MRQLRALWRATSALLGGLLVLASVAGWGRPAGTPVGEVQQVDATRAVRLLTSRDEPATPQGGRPSPRTALVSHARTSSGSAASSGAPAVARSLLPSDFGTVMGYRPVLSDGRLIRADGGCSSPFGPTEFGFGDACRAHDLGYDLLRYADRKGQPLGPWARRALDEQFDHALHARCAADAPTTTCHTAATVYADAVRINSLRQGYGVPVVEGSARTLLGLLLGVLVAVLLLLGGTSSVRRRDPDRSVARLRVARPVVPATTP